MKFKLYISIVLAAASFMFLPLSSNALAQKTEQSYRSRYLPFNEKRPKPKTKEFTSHFVYHKMAQKLMQGAVNQTDYLGLRFRYTKSFDYDPLGEDTINQMMGLVFLIEQNQESDNRAEIEKSISAYLKLLQRHIANFDVVSRAVVLAKQNPKLGDVEKLMAIRQNLFENFTARTKGLDLDTAFQIVTLGEETAILKHMRQRILKTETLRRGLRIYHVHEVETAQGLRGVTYIDVTLPIKFLEDNF